MQPNLIITWTIVQEQRRDWMRQLEQERLICQARVARQPEVKAGHDPRHGFSFLMRSHKAAT